jgi:hypothetical protein
MRTNREGLTLAEWVNAANLFRKVKLDRQMALCAWLNGEDPTEYMQSPERK